MQADTFITRIADSQDVIALCAFGESFILPHYEPLIGEAAAQRQVRDWWNRAVFERAVADRTVIVAESELGLVGVGQFGSAQLSPTIYKLYVHPSWRGHGVGPILLSSVVSHLPPNTRRVFIEHFAANERAGRFYDRQGFIVDHVHDDPSGDPALAIVWRIKTLE